MANSSRKKRGESYPSPLDLFRRLLCGVLALVCDGYGECIGGHLTLALDFLLGLGKHTSVDESSRHSVGLIRGLSDGLREVYAKHRAVGKGFNDSLCDRLILLLGLGLLTLSLLVLGVEFDDKSLCLCLDIFCDVGRGDYLVKKFSLSPSVFSFPLL